jgi:DNA-binding IclR family transcriptional regulator
LKDNHQTPSVPALERALLLLETLGKSKRGLSLGEFAYKLRIPRSSTYALLRTLQRHGYLHRNAHTHRYMFGLKFFSLANSGLADLDLREQAAAHLADLLRRTRLTVHLGILEQEGVVIVDKVEAPSLLKLATWIGKRLDVHCTSMGKALLAYLPDEDLNRFFSKLREHALPRHNQNTITSVQKLREELTRVKTRGYAVDDEEDEVGLRAVGAPIFGHTGCAIAAVSVAGTIAQITRKNLASIAKQVKRTTGAISHDLGHLSGRL